MRCNSVEPLLDAFRTGELPAEAAGRVHDHLGACPGCQQAMRDLDRLAAFGKSARFAPPSSRRDAVIAECSDALDRIAVEGGDVWVVFSPRGVLLIRHGGTEDEVAAIHRNRSGRLLRRESLPERLREQVSSSLQGEQVRNPAIDWGSRKSDLERQILETLLRIPRGEVRTYDWVAREVGRPKAMRAVGNVCARNALPFLIPCHRVVPSTGGVGNYAFGPALKRELLRREGVDVDRLEALGRRHVRYIGSRTTKIACFPTCRDARRIREENRVALKSAAAATEDGYRPCKHCRPFAVAPTSARREDSVGR
ncbi:MAG TPA: methylated-DNA--[protein]-cysteine S-methyltransferase [Thermoanaerobaculia bacterium]